MLNAVCSSDQNFLPASVRAMFESEVMLPVFCCVSLVPRTPEMNEPMLPTCSVLGLITFGLVTFGCGMIGAKGSVGGVVVFGVVVFGVLFVGMMGANGSNLTGVGFGAGVLSVNVPPKESRIG
jgi:hypothetical protein